MQLRYKVVSLGVVPLVIAGGLMAIVVQSEGKELEKTQSSDGESSLLAAKQEELRVLVGLAVSAVPELKRADRDEKRALEDLRKLSFLGKDVYFYIYNVDTKICLMNARHRDLEGKEQTGLKDDEGTPILAPLLERANAGGGFIRYRWLRPSYNRWEWKLGYVEPLPGRWMIGTGVYIDEVEEIKNLKGRIRVSSSEAIRETMIFIAAIAASAVLVVVVTGLALNVSQQRLADSRLRRLMWEVMAAEEKERGRVSRYLHDEAMQELIALKWNLETTRGELASHFPHGKLTDLVECALTSLTGTLDGIRTLSRGFRTRVQGDRLAPRIEQLAAAFEGRTAVAVTVDARVTLRKLSVEAATALYIVTELALNNVERQAHASRVAIQLAACARWGTRGTRLTVSDDGCGFDIGAVTDGAGDGVGLLHMRERIEALGGRFSIRSGPNGTTINALLPDRSTLKDDGHDKA